MLLKTFVFNPFMENTYVLSSSNGDAIIFDPGCYENYEINEISSYIENEGLEVKMIVNTHCHIDHVLGNEVLKRKYGCPFKIPKNELEVFNAQVPYAPQWGIVNYQPAEVDEFLNEGDTIVLDEIRLKAIEVSGHSPGHLVFYDKDKKILIGGDVLFRESIGRTDLPGGNHDDLLRNIKEKVYPLPEDTTVYPGHGPETTIGYEKSNNPFVRA